MAELMIVDDDLEFLMSSTEALTRGGHIVRPVMKSRDALKLIESWSPDLIFCDIRMPGMDGFQLNDHFQKELPLTPVVFVSAREAEGESLLRGGRDFLRKPIHYRNFCEKVKTLLDHRLDFAKILVADDDSYNRLLLTSALEESFMVVTASEGRAALDLLENDPEISLLITDVKLSGGSGLDLIREMRRNRRLQKLPVMVQTSENIDLYSNALEELGVEKVMNKRAFFQWLLRIVRRLSARV